MSARAWEEKFWGFYFSNHVLTFCHQSIIFEHKKFCLSCRSVEMNVESLVNGLLVGEKLLVNRLDSFLRGDFAHAA